MPDDDETLPQPLLRATELLRVLPDVSDAWRRDLQRSLDGNAATSMRSGQRRWSVTPIAAIAACLLCAVLGGMIVKVFGGSAVTAAPIVATAAPGAALNVRFDLVAPTASQVAIVGDFNQWNAQSLPMRRSADGRRWEIEVRLPPGRYTYGFIVDGRLTPDPRAPENASDDFGIPSSVRMVSRVGGS